MSNTNGLLLLGQKLCQHLNTLMSGLIQAVHTWLCAGISLLRLALWTWSKCQKTQEVL